MKQHRRIQPLVFTCLALLPLSEFALAASDLNLLNFHCSRKEEQNGQKYLSEITFVKSGHVNIPPSSTWVNQNIEGQVMSYLIRDESKTFISGYSLFSISYHDHIISGMTGDPMTTTDGTFTMTSTKGRINGPWLFSYTGINGQHIKAEFNCTVFPN